MKEDTKQMNRLFADRLEARVYRERYHLLHLLPTLSLTGIWPAEAPEAEAVQKPHCSNHVFQFLYLML